MELHINTKSDSAKAKEDLAQLAKLTMAKKILKAGGAEMQKDTERNMTAKYTGHYEGKKFVKTTGATRRSVRLTVDNGGLRVRVTVGTEYFPYLELGTRYMASRPTLKPAFEQAKTEAAKRLDRMKE